MIYFIPQFRKLSTSGLFSNLLSRVLHGLLWKKVRTKEITVEQAEVTLELFESDFVKYNFITTDSLILERPRNLTTKYGVEGLRTLDSIQLSTCIELAKKADVFYTADKFLKTLIEKEGLPTKMPSR